MNSQFAKPFSFSSLIGFALPNMVMMVFLSMYTIVDGTFVSCYAGTAALSAVNMVSPLITVEMAAAIMIATGGSAIIARRMGEGAYPFPGFSLFFFLFANLLMGDILTMFGKRGSRHEGLSLMPASILSALIILILSEQGSKAS